MIDIYKEDAVALFRNQARLAQTLNITKQAICAWSWGAPIPERQALRLVYEIGIPTTAMHQLEQKHKLRVDRAKVAEILAGNPLLSRDHDDANEIVIKPIV